MLIYEELLQPHFGLRHQSVLLSPNSPARKSFAVSATQQHYLSYSLLLFRMKAGLSYMADPLNTDVGEVAYCARHYGCPVLCSAQSRSCEGNVGSGWSGRNSERKMFMAAIERRSSWL